MHLHSTNDITVFMYHTILTNEITTDGSLVSFLCDKESKKISTEKYYTY